jgi:sec-independent protein translocase protein TatC
VQYFLVDSKAMLSHLIEFRRRTLYALIFYVAAFGVFFFFAPHLFHRLVSPLLSVLPLDSSLIAIELTTTLMMPIKLAADASMLVSAPFVLWHAWQFASPGLHRHERSSLGWAIVISLLLFFIGVVFGFYVVLPFLFQFFVSALPSGVHFMPDMAYAIDFITRTLLLFGFCFQVPLICVVLIRMRIISVTTLIAIRPYFIVMAFIVGMLLTPPDVFSQIMLAVPLCLLYESGIILSKCLEKRLPRMVD